MASHLVTRVPDFASILSCRGLFVVEAIERGRGVVQWKKRAGSVSPCACRRVVRVRVCFSFPWERLYPSLVGCVEQVVCGVAQYTTFAV